MKKIIFISCLILCACMLSSTVYAEMLEVEKTVENSNITVGDDVKILLKFKNPFNESINIKIVDKNIFGNNGLDIQCFEHTLPLQGQIVAYEPIKPFAPGNYTLDEAQINYTNPKTGKEETVKSNKLELEVKDSAQKMQGQTQSITTIYQCGGMSMKSTSQTSSTQPEEQESQEQKEQNRPENRIQSNQLNQNTDELKQEINEEIQKQEQIHEEFNKNIQNNSDFQKLNKELADKGYNLTNSKLAPSSNNTGNFEFSYQKDNKTASMKGRMENGTMKELMSQTGEDREKMLESLMKNEKFQEYDNQLTKQGFNMTGINFTQVSQNYTKIEVSYENNNTNQTNQTNSTEVNKIIAEYKNGEIKNVYLENNKENNKNLSLFLILMLFLIALAVYFFKVKKKRNIQKSDNAKEQKAERDYIEDVREMLIEARKLFNNNQEKDAYEKVSQAIRFYFSNKLNINKEITNSELLNILEKNEIKHGIKRCLGLCALVEFAKYKANRSDFDEIIRIAEDIIAYEERGKTE